MSQIKLSTRKTQVLVIGSGCAGLNAADTLHKLGVTDILLATEGLLMGTSRNTGSDKQTYYKLAISSDSRDDVSSMAESYFSCGAMSGEHALIESANSLACFFKLCGLGVPFPKNEYGEYVGYQTDHDATKRATSVGPLTSKLMTEALERSVRSNQTEIIDGLVIFKLFAENGKICGALGFNKKTQCFIHINTPSIILATGGSSIIYRDSVFPVSQTGMSGMAYEAGAKTSNLSEWQYGLASTDFRWNVSGSYQQVLPRYVSIDANGVEYDFLTDSLGVEKALLYTFRKGYQWPFDSQKKNDSSIIDQLVHAEISKGRRVYLDFTRNPVGFCVDSLPDEASIYLKNCNAQRPTPIERLIAMNERAYELYKSHNIDLKTEKLRIAVCAQHQNGGLWVDKNYETSIKGLYAAGESAGVFGICRPGGSALNSTQVSSMRAASHIAKASSKEIPDAVRLSKDFLENLRLCFDKSEAFDFRTVMREIQADMSEYASFIRDEKEISKLSEKVSSLIASLHTQKVMFEEMSAFLKYRDFLYTLREVLAAMLLWCRKIGARGGAISVLSEKYANNTDIICTENGSAFFESPLPIPKSETWFEKIYNKK